MALLVILDVPKMENSLILVWKLRYMDMIKIFGVLKSFTFVMFRIGGAFKKSKMALFLFLKWRNMDAPYQKGRLYSGDSLFIYIYQFLHQKAIFICIAKIAFYWLGLSIFQKILPECTTSLAFFHKRIDKANKWLF